MSEDEIKMVTEQAEKLGLTVSAYIRMLIHTQETKRDDIAT
jgi:predicted DNA binding CopG/RHH family protein